MALVKISVKDNNGLPIANAPVTVDGTTKGNTDTHGIFKLDLEENKAYVIGQYLRQFRVN